MQVCTSLQTDNHASTSPLSFFTGRMPFLAPNQQRQRTEGKSTEGKKKQSYALTTKPTTCVIQYRGYFADIMQKRIATTCSLGLPPTGPFTHLLIFYLLPLKPHSKMQAYRTHNHAR